MGFDYSYHYELEESMFWGFLIVWGIAVLIGLALGIAMYVIRALSVYSIAKRRGLNRPWLAWVPVGYEWLLGSVSDQYKYLTAGKIQNRRKILLGLTIASLVCSLLTTVVSVANLIGGGYDRLPILSTVLMSLVTMIVSISGYVFQCMSKYDLYKSCDPKNAVAYLVVGIFVNVTEPFFLLYCRNRDNGMPPRRPVEPEFVPVQEPEAGTAEEPASDPWNQPEE